MFKIGQKVQFDGIEPITGYIVAITIDPFEESDVYFEAHNWVTYVIRVYKPFYKDGYADYYRSEEDLRNVDN